MFRDEFMTSLRSWTGDPTVPETMWHELAAAYSGPHRYYHTLRHLDAMTAELAALKTDFTNWDAVVFAIGYHDFVYDRYRADNESRSAQVAAERLGRIALPGPLVETCCELILATKDHHAAGPEVNLFTDADLAILGADRQAYREYARNIFLELGAGHYLLYQKGRANVLRKFLAMPAIFKTDAFATRYEQPARENITWELEQLQSGTFPEQPTPVG